jgi:hypothetical protein
LVDGYSRVDAKAHAVLADINELGFITVDSQEGDAKKSERAYVNGYVRTSIVEKLLETINRAEGVVAWGYTPVPSHAFRAVSAIPVTYSERDGRPATRLPTVATRSELHSMKRADLPAALADDATMVQVMDAVWGRLAFRKGGLFPIVKQALVRTGETAAKARR